MNNGNDYSPHEEVNNYKSDKYEYLKSLDISKLQSLLQQESFFNDDDFDADLIRRIIAILDERDPIDDEPDPAVALKTFKEEIIPELEKERAINSMSQTIQTTDSIRASKFRRRFRTILIAAIVSILLGSTLVASAFGYKIWEYVFSWGKETFQIGTGTQVTAGSAVSPSPSSGANIVKQNKFQTLDEAIKALNVYILVPRWMPTSFEFSSASISESSQRKSLTAVYKSDVKTILFSVFVYSTREAAYSYEIDEGSGESNVISGYKCHIMTNIDRVGAVWIDDKTVYNINGNVSKDELTKMVNSIYKGDT